MKNEMKKIKIAFDASQTGRRKAGCGFYAAALLNSLLKTSGDIYNFTALTSYGSFFHDQCHAIAFPEWKKRPNYGPRFLTRNSATLFWNSKKKASAYLDQFDIVHANNFWCPPWAISGCLIYTLYDMSFLEKPQWTTDKNRTGCLEGIQRAALYADIFIAISEATKQSFLSHFPKISPSRVTVIYPASRYSLPGFNQKPKRPKELPLNIDKNFFLTVGTIEPRKNQEFLLHIYEEYRRRENPAVPLIFAGKYGWLMDDFKERIGKSKWRKDIHILGYVNDNELMWLYSCCLANLYPSLYEGFGLPVLEGMSFGACTVASDKTSMPEIVKESGILLSPHDTEGWIKTISELACSPQKVMHLGNLALTRANDFSWKRSTCSVISIYEQVRNNGLSL